MLSVVILRCTTAFHFHFFTVFGSFAFAAPLSDVVGNELRAARKRRSVKALLFVADTEKNQACKSGIDIRCFALAAFLFFTGGEQRIIIPFDHPLRLELSTRCPRSQP